MPKTLPNKAIDTYKGLIRETWLPSFVEPSGEETYGAIYGGVMAYMEHDAMWPIHNDGLPMDIIFQTDTDSLPFPLVERFGGRGKVFQLFMPLGEGDEGPRHWDESGDELAFFFTVRILDKTSDLTPDVMPNCTDPDDHITTKFVRTWERRLDLPFVHGGPYDGDIEKAHETWKEIVEGLIGADDSDAKYEEVTAQLYHPDDREAGRNSDLTGFNEWGDKIGGWPSLEQGPIEGVDESCDVVLQFNGGIGSGHLAQLSEEIAFDGHAWLFRNSDGEWVWHSVTS